MDSQQGERMANKLGRFIALGLLVITVGMGLGLPRAATPTGGTISPSSATLNFAGGPFDFTNQTGVPSSRRPRPFRRSA
jgi:hypothetical protein